MKERVELWIGESLGVADPERASRQEVKLVNKKAPQRGDPKALVRVNLVNNKVEVQVNAAGDRLHRRGWKVGASGTPIRETLAAGCLRAAAMEIAHSEGWLAGQEGIWSHKNVIKSMDVLLRRGLWDPFCGSGTFVLEAMDNVYRVVNHLPRHFAFEDWPTHDRNTYHEFLQSPVAGDSRLTLSKLHRNQAKFYGSDIRAVSIAASKRNATTMGSAAASHSEFLKGDFMEVVGQIPHGVCIMTNVPYGYKTNRGKKFSEIYRK